MNKIKAKQCLHWFEENYNNYAAWDDEDEINQVRSLLKDLSEGKIVVCVPFSDELLHNIFEHNNNPEIDHSTRCHYEDIGFNHACRVMVATGRMAKT